VAKAVLHFEQMTMSGGDEPKPRFLLGAGALNVTVVGDPVEGTLLTLPKAR